MNDFSHPDHPEDELQQDVVAELRKRHTCSQTVPPELDAAILADAAKHLQSHSRRSGTRRWLHRRAWVAISAGTLTAATLIFAVHTFQTQEVPSSDRFAVRNVFDDSTPTVAERPSNDIDGNGRVDILDAFAVARSLQSGQLPGLGMDRNGDGQVDHQDVDLIAMSAVML